MNKCIDSKALHNRLNRVVGQINAAKSALHKAGQIVLESHMRCCVRDGIQNGDAEETIKKFAKAIERFSNI